MQTQLIGRLGAIAAAVLTVPVVMLGSAPQALACSCADVPFAVQAERADAVFTGRVVGRSDGAGAPVPCSADPVGADPVGADPVGADQVVWTFEVGRVDKGSPAPIQRVTSPRSEASCGWGFEIGRTYLVVATAAPDGSLTTGLCSGTTPVVAAEPLARAPAPSGAPLATPAPPGQ